jgi:5-methylcytosine-specific restriction protein B
VTSIEKLTQLIMLGRGAPEGKMREAIASLFGDRFSQATAKDAQIRDAYGLARDDSEAGVPWAGLINPDNPGSGPYGGTSLVWFPGDKSTLIGLGVGTRGISPDEGILTRPGHRRRIAALRRLLAQKGVLIWSKADPAALGVAVPKDFSVKLPEFAATFKRYANEMYLVAQVPAGEALACEVVAAFVDLYGYERNWTVLKAFERDAQQLQSALRGELFRVPSVELVAALVKQRRFVVLQGAPGTGKTRLAEQVKREAFNSRGTTIQFHPSVTYEDFIIGLSPDTADEALRFRVRSGALLEAATAAAQEDHLLVIDEINRADLGKVLGEAIYLFEAGEVGGARARSIRLPHAIGEQTTFQFPERLYVLGTMNTADRSIASLDLAIRRRFAFVNVPPDRAAIAANAPAAALDYFDSIADVFVEHAPDDALDLLPGQAYFLAKDDETLQARMKFELIPLLDDYLRQGLLGTASAELQSVRDRLADAVT